MGDVKLDKRQRVTGIDSSEGRGLDKAGGDTSSWKQSRPHQGRKGRRGDMILVTFHISCRTPIPHELDLSKQPYS